MGEDEENTLKEIPIEDSFDDACLQFFTLCETVVNAVYEIMKKRPQPQVFVVGRPVAVSPTKRKKTRNPLNPFESIMGGNENLEQALKIEKPDTTFDDIGGLKEEKRLVEGLALALQNPELYQKWGTRPPKGVLLVGPPGNGKTMLAKALANATDATFYHVKITDILSMWHGKSEENIDRVFNLAKENAPAIIFFDEIDSLGHDRGGSGGMSTDNISRHIVTILLQNLDGVEDLKKVIVMAATNRVDDIDPALRRAGRFDRIIPVDVPDMEARTHILSIHIAAAERRAGRKLFDISGPEDFANRLDGVSGADIAELVRRTLEVKAQMDLEGKDPGFVSDQDFSKEIETYERLMKQTSDAGFLASRNKK
jgi:transitional endoplasmic reticulum ATPase